MENRVWMVLLLSFALGGTWVGGCSDTDDEGGRGGDGLDGDGTSGEDDEGTGTQDTGEETGGVGSDTADDSACPLNSGYPCACDGAVQQCDDGSMCAAAGGMNAICTASCSGQQNDPVCASSWGIQAADQVQGGACLLAAPNTAPTNCVIMCTYVDTAQNGISYTGPCPPGLDCELTQSGSITQGLCI